MDKKRLLFVDTFKVIIILLMIQGHLLRALLAPPYYAGSRWFPLHEFLHGIVAPGFLFLSGFLFAYTLVEKPKSPDLFFNKISSAFGLFAVNAFDMTFEHAGVMRYRHAEHLSIGYYEAADLIV